MEAVVGSDQRPHLVHKVVVDDGARALCRRLGVSWSAPRWRRGWPRRRALTTAPRFLGFVQGGN